MRLLLAAIALGTLGVLLLRKPQRVAARPYVEPEDGVQPVDPRTELGRTLDEDRERADPLNYYPAWVWGSQP